MSIIMTRNMTYTTPHLCSRVICVSCRSRLSDTCYVLFIKRLILDRMDICVIRFHYDLL